MTTKQGSCLKSIVKEADALKKRVDSILKQSNNILKSKSKSEKVVQEQYTKILSVAKDINTLLKNANALKQENEKIKINRWVEKRNDEIKRLKKFKDEIEDLANKFRPAVGTSEESEEESEEGSVTGEDDTVSEQEDESIVTERSDNEITDEEKPSKNLIKSTNVSHSEENSTEEEEASEDEDDKDETDDSESDTDQEEIISRREKERITTEEEESHEDDSGSDEEVTETEVSESESGITQTEEDSTEEEETETESEEETELESTSGEEETEEDDEIEDGGTRRLYQAISDYDAQQAQDLSFKAGEILTVIQARESGWFEAENAEGERGDVPSNYLKVYSKYQESTEEETTEDEGDQKTPRSGRQLWGNIRKAVKETSVTDVLHALGAVPAGFRESTLAKLASQDIYSMGNYLHPKLSTSCLMYRDLFYDDVTEQIRHRSVRIQRVITLVNCRQIPLPGTGIEILSRHVRICLFDGKNMLSNIHVIRVQGVDKDKQQWTFNTKLTDTVNCLQFGECFIRSNSSEGNIGILFELCMSYKRSNTNEQSEFSCGWVHLPLTDNNGYPVNNKSHDLFVHGGTPYEKGVDVDPNIGKKGNTSKLRTLMAGNKQPRMTIKLSQPTKEHKELLDTLPDVLIGNTCHLYFLSTYRQILSDVVLRDCVDPQSIEPIFSPMLCSFPLVVEQPDLMDILRQAWLRRLKLKKKNERRDHEGLKEIFQQVYMESIYPFLMSDCLPAFKLGYMEIEKERQEELRRLLNLGKQKNAVASLLSHEAVHKAFDISELSFNIIRSPLIIK